jgi:hypothetical protein
VTENGTYTAPDGVDGYSPITVNVPIPDGYIVPSGTKEIISNGNHNVAEYENVNVNVPIPDGYIKPSGTLNITENGTYDVTEKASAVVSIPEKEIVLQNKTIEENGTYTADSGYDGLGQVTVNVSGGEENRLDEILNGTITTIDSNVTKIISYGCYGIRTLTSVNLPKCNSIGSYAFRGCDYLATINAPKVTSLGSYGFFGTKITEVIFPLTESVPSNCFYTCSALEKADFGVAKSIAASSFYGCSKLSALILRKTEAICTLSNANAIQSAGVGKGTGYVYVPSALIETYKAATNWSTFADQFRALEDYTVDGTVSGELDESKI